MGASARSCGAQEVAGAELITPDLGAVAKLLTASAPADELAACCSADVGTLLHVIHSLATGPNAAVGPDGHPRSTIPARPKRTVEARDVQGHHHGSCVRRRPGVEKKIPTR
jgi:hypothetical protein